MRIGISSISVAFIIFFSCSDKPGEAESPIIGKWYAQWVTDPASFPEVKDIKSFSMNGEITFYPDSVEINAFGFPGCIFSSDTLNHSLKWKIHNDTLSLLNENDVYGMFYHIREMNDNIVRLQLMEDIFLTLKK